MNTYIHKICSSTLYTVAQYITLLILWKDIEIYHSFMQINILTHFSHVVFDIHMKLKKYIKHIMERKKSMRNVKHVLKKLQLSQTKKL